MIEIIPNWHPIFVHFTIALFSIATLLIVASMFVKSDFGEKILTSGYFNLWLGGIFTVATIAAGFHAYGTVNHDGPSHAAMTDHRNWAIAVASVFLLLTLWSIKLYRDNKKRHPVFVAGLVIATALLMVTGWKGAEVVYRHGIGVISMPNADTHQHHADDHMPADHMDAPLDKPVSAPTPVSAPEPESHSHDHASHNHGSHKH